MHFKLGRSMCSATQVSKLLQCIRPRLQRKSDKAQSIKSSIIRLLANKSRKRDKKKE